MTMNRCFALNNENALTEGAGLQVTDVGLRRFITGPGPGITHSRSWKGLLEVGTHRLRTAGLPLRTGFGAKNHKIGGRTMQVPLKITFRNVRKTPDVEALIAKQAAKLERVCDHIIGCQVAVEKPQEHQREGNPFRVRIDVTVPPEHELVVTREASEGDLHDRLPTVLRAAFDAMRRQLQKLAEKQRKEVKTHPEQEVGGFVSRLFRQQGYGFIKGLDGREIYFHKNSLTEGEFERLDIGTGVHWVEQDGDKGPQASFVRIVDKRGSRASMSPES